jgi:hypothetical protein
MSALPIFPLATLYLLLSALALFVTKPASGLRAVVLTLIIGIAMLGALGLAVTAIVNAINYQASWSYDQ